MLGVGDKIGVRAVHQVHWRALEPLWISPAVFLPQRDINGRRRVFRREMALEDLSFFLFRRKFEPTVPTVLGFGRIERLAAFIRTSHRIRAVCPVGSKDNLGH
jgi:hypothetical protein